MRARRTSTAFCARSASIGDQQATLALRHPWIGQCDVVTHGLVEKKILLKHDADLPLQLRRIHLREIYTAYQNSSPLRHIGTCCTIPLTTS